MTMTEQQVNEVLQTARLTVLTKYPYLAPLVMKMGFIITPKVQTAGIDAHLRVYWNPDFVSKLDMSKGHNEVCGVLLHEAMHALLRHKHRNKFIGGQAPIDNIAMDMEINSVIREDAVFPLPSMVVYPEQAKDAKGVPLPSGETFEWYYGQLLQNAQSMQGKGVGAGDCGEGATGRKGGYEEGDGEGKGETGESDAPSDIDVDMAVDVACESIAKHPGNVHQSLKRYANARLAPAKVPWQSVLRRILTAQLERRAGFDEVGYQRLSRRTHALNAAGNAAALPSRYSVPLNVVVGIDTSGSMGPNELQSALQECQGVARAVGASIRAFCIDTEVSGKIQEIEYGKLPNLSGGGGTDMGAGIAFGCSMKPSPDVVVILTDCYTPWPSVKPRVPVVVCAIGNKNPTGVPAWAKLVVAD